MDGIRVHEGSPYELGFQAGYEWPGMGPMPTCPATVKGGRARRRWAHGLREGIDSGRILREQRLEKGRKEAARGAYVPDSVRRFARRIREGSHTASSLVEHGLEQDEPQDDEAA
jgi:hypothetical protein